MKALFVCHEHSLVPGGGGQQICTREYRDVLKAADFDLEILTYGTDRSLATRLRRRFRPTPYADLFADDLYDRIVSSVARLEAGFVFLNLYNLVPAGSELRRRLGGQARLVLMSHGLNTVDELHALRIDEQLHSSSGSGDDWRPISHMLRVESANLPLFDHIFCLAPFEVEICRWLGAQSVSWWPRTIPREALDWRPAGDRLGCIGTMDHPPNEEGLFEILNALEPIALKSLRFRLVSRSTRICQEAAERFAFVDFLGPLENPDAVREEASTWNAFIHPIFCYAMGCSTKMATGLGWRIPVLSSRAGFRGYSWSEGEIPMPSNPNEMAREAIALLDEPYARNAQTEVVKAAQSAPTYQEIGQMFRKALGI